MKILLFGKNGQVGWALNQSLQALGEITALGREDADFSESESLRGIVRHNSPDIIINAVAYTAVDKAEEEEDLAAIINGTAPGVLAEEASKIKALFVHYSTDYVFDGGKDSPYTETDSLNPINAYGRTKLAGELAVQSSGCDYLIFRTSWVYSSRGHNFLLTILRLAQEREELSIVADQYGAPTSANLIAETSLKCVKQAMLQRSTGSFSSGLYHLTASGYTSWYGFAEEIVKRLGQSSGMPSGVSLKTKLIKGIPSVDYPTPAARPMNSRLSLSKLQQAYNLEMPDWQQTLSLCIEMLNEKRG